MAGNWTQTLPGPYIDIEIIGDSRAVDNMMRSLYTAFENQNIAEGLLREFIDPALRERTKERFAGEGDDVSGPWLPLADATVERRGSAHPINVRTGQMKRHLVDDPPRVEMHSLGATMWSPGSEGLSSEMQSKIKTAQMGGMTPEGNPVPARPVLGVNERDLEIVMVQMAAYMGKYVGLGGAEVNFI